MAMMAMMSGGGELENLVDKLTEDKFLDFIEGYLDEHCEIFEPESDENKLEYTTTHTEYKRFFESRLESHLKLEKIDHQDFLQLCQQMQQMQDPNAVALIDVFAAVDDFEAFVSMMKQRKQEIAEDED